MRGGDDGDADSGADDVVFQRRGSGDANSDGGNGGVLGCVNEGGCDFGSTLKSCFVVVVVVTKW